MSIVMLAKNSKIQWSTKRIVLAVKKTMNGDRASLVLSWGCCLNSATSDYNFVRNGDECVPVGPERIPAGVCTGGPDQTYQGSSGWRKIPGNTCVDGLARDAKVDKKCSQGTPLIPIAMANVTTFPSSSTRGRGGHPPDCRLLTS